MKYTSMFEVMSKFRRDTNLQVEEADFIEWAAEALEAMGAAQAQQESVCLISVSNYQCIVPDNLLYIIQVAKNNCATTAVDAEEAAEEEEEEEAGQPVPLDCDGTPITGYDLAYYRPYYDLVYEYEGWTRSESFQTCFTPIRLADHSFFNSVVCREDNTDLEYLYQTSKYEYTFADPYLRFSFQEGQVALSYLKYRCDEHGYPEVPDHYSVKTAITKYVTFQLMNRKYLMSDQPVDERRLAKAEADWQWYAGQAGNWLMMPKTVDDLQDLLDQRTYLLPRQHSYYNFFGKRSQVEQKAWSRFERRLNRHAL